MAFRIPRGGGVVPLCRLRGSGDWVSGNIPGSSARAGSEWSQRTFLPPMTFPNSPLGWRRRYGTPFRWWRPALIRSWWNGSCPSGTEPELSCAGICGGYSPSGKRSFFQDFAQQEMKEFLAANDRLSFGKNQAAPIHDCKRFLSLLRSGLSGHEIQRNGEIGKSAVRPPRRWAGRGTVQAGRRFP